MTRVGKGLHMPSVPAHILHASHIIGLLLHPLLLCWTCWSNFCWFTDSTLLLRPGVWMHKWLVIPQLLDSLTLLAALNNIDRLLQHLKQQTAQHVTCHSDATGEDPQENHRP